MSSKAYGTIRHTTLLHCPTGESYSALKERFDGEVASSRTVHDATIRVLSEVPTGGTIAEMTWSYTAHNQWSSESDALRWIYTVIDRKAIKFWGPFSGKWEAVPYGSIVLPVSYTDETAEAAVASIEAKYNLIGTILREHGTSGGWPDVRFKGAHKDVLAFARRYFMGESDEWVRKQIQVEKV